MIAAVIVPLADGKSIRRDFDFPFALTSVLGFCRTQIALIEQIKYPFNIRKNVIVANDDGMFSVIIYIEEPPENISNEIINLLLESKLKNWRIVSPPFPYLTE